MSTSPVVHLDDYRGRREQRRRLTRALHGAHGEKRRLLGLLEHAVGVLDADRAAVLWVDEYGPGLVHVHTLLDLLSDSPRRSFSLEPLRRAWQAGVPGIMDAPDMERGEIPVLGEAARSACAVALGSDGARAWFLVADGSAARRPIDEATAESLMFLSGEAASIVLHRDLETSASGEAGERFTGWTVLQDVEGRERDSEAGRRISARFLVVRTLLGVAEEDFTADPEGLTHQVEATRRELADVLAGDPERESWDAVLEALERRDLGALADATMTLATQVDGQGHVHGAATLFSVAYDAALAGGAASVATEAGRLLGRLERRRGAWDRAVHWYGVARDVARQRDDRATEAVVLSGWANVLRDKGNLPGAREVLHEGLEVARESRDGYALGSAHHDLMAVEQDTGQLGRAIVHGWRAVEVYPDEENRLYAMAALAGCFLQTGEIDAADDAYSIVRARVENAEYRVVAQEGLAHVAAVRGETRAFHSLSAECDAMGWSSDAGVWTRAQILLFRGLSYEVLGRSGEALSWLGRARDFAEANGVNKVFFDASAACNRVLVGRDVAERGSENLAPPEEMPSIRQELTAMREALAAV